MVMRIKKDSSERLSKNQVRAIAAEEVNKSRLGRYGRCVKKVEKKQSKVNPYAVCRTSTGYKGPTRGVNLKHKITRKDAIYTGLPKQNARNVQLALRRKGVKTHAVPNKYGTYDIYVVEK